MKRYFLPVFALVLLLKLTACGDSNVEEKLYITGSNTIGEHLMPQLIRAFLEQEGIKIQLFQETEIQSSRAYVIKGISKDTFFTITIRANGSKEGLADLKNRKTDIAMISESQLMAQWQGDTLRLASDSIVIVAHRHNPIDRLTVGQLQDIFVGKTQNWQELTPQYSGTIHTHIRDTSSGTFSTFQHLILNDAAYNPTAKRHFSNADLFDDIRRDYYGIGYISASEKINNEYFKTFSIDNQHFERSLYLFSDGKKDTDLARRFRRFCRSQTARKIIESLKFGF
jgi:ABC-type phosphate transport system substrate-binding protein